MQPKPLHELKKVIDFAFINKLEIKVKTVSGTLKPATVKKVISTANVDDYSVRVALELNNGKKGVIVALASIINITF